MNNKIIQINTENQFAEFCDISRYSILSLEKYALHNPDASFAALDASHNIKARCSVWWSNVPEYLNHNVGIIGHYAALNDDSGKDLLSYVCNELSMKGCSIAIGPMDGSTWRKHRFITYRGTEPLFFLESDQPDEWPKHFISSGFSSLAVYFSTLNENLSFSDYRISLIEENIRKNNITIHPLNIELFDKELNSIYEASALGFSNNFLYTPISKEEMFHEYRSVYKYITSDLVLLAKIEKKVIGFIFAVPDILETERANKINTVILKSMTVIPQYRSIGLGTLLMSYCQKRAESLGFKKAIHAYMHESNLSRRISQKLGGEKIIRHYTLFAKSLVK